MTPITKPVRRRSSTFVKDGPRKGDLVVILHPTFLTLRIAGSRREETVDYESAFFHAIKSRVFREKMTKAKERKEKQERAAATRRFLSMSKRAVKKSGLAA